MLLNIQIQYVAMLRERTGKSEERLTTAAETIGQLYQELAGSHGFPWPRQAFRPAINDRIVEWTTPLSNNDRVLFLPPSSGG